MHPQNSVKFSIDLSKCRAHIFNVTMELSAAVKNQELSLPVWTPGSYMVREFAQHIISIEAHEAHKKIEVSKIDKNTFRLNNETSSVVVTYQVYGFDSSIRAAFIDNTQAFFNGTALFLRPHGQEDRSHGLQIVKNNDAISEAWQVATAMPAVDVDSQGFGSYSAQSYDELVDYPFQISAMKRLPFQVSNLPHEIVLVGDVRPFDEKRLLRDLTRIGEEQIKLFGSAPFKKYLFIARFEENAHGGLEHRNSSMLLATPYGLPRVGQAEPDSHYRHFLSLCSHEYFHAWNVKSLKPRNFIKLDLNKECYTSLLWLFEGLTSYYDDLLVKRSGLMTVTNYLDLLGRNYGKLLRTRGRLVQSLAESSFDTWIKFYRPNENSQNSGVSYYLKGSFIGLYLDMLIRSKSKGEISLDTIMREAFNQYKDHGITEEEFFALLAKVGKIDIEDFKTNYIYGTKDVPLEDMLYDVGVDVLFLPDEGILDDKTRTSAYLGIKIKYDEHQRVLIAFVENDAQGMHAGLSVGDEIVAINGCRVDTQNASDIFSGLRPNDPVEICYARKRRMHMTTIVPGKLPEYVCKLSLNPQIDTEKSHRLKQWLGQLETSR